MRKEISVRVGEAEVEAVAPGEVGVAEALQVLGELHENGEIRERFRTRIPGERNVDEMRIVVCGKFIRRLDVGEKPGLDKILELRIGAVRRKAVEAAGVGIVYPRRPRYSVRLAEAGDD